MSQHFSEPLLQVGANDAPETNDGDIRTGVSRTRWWVLLQYSLLTFNQGWYAHQRHIHFSSH
jgi:hypothetical protein